MSLIEKLESGEKLEFFDVTLAPGDGQATSAEVDGMQPLSSTNNLSVEIVSSICSRCKIEFNSDEELERHAETEHKIFETDDKEALRQTSELSAVLAALSDQCPEIMKINEKEPTEITPKEAAIIKEIDDKNDLKVINCDICQFKAKSDRAIRMHMKNTHEVEKKPGKKLKCKTCDFKSLSPTVMGVHMRKLHKLMHKCDECVEEFKTRGELAHHKRIHVAAYKCEKCPFKGTSQRTLTIHMNKNHMLDITPKRGTKREQETQSPYGTSQIKVTKEETVKQMKKKAKQNDNIELPKKENQVIGGAGWSLTGKDSTEPQIKNTESKTKPKPDIPVKLTHLPNRVACTLPDHKDSILQLVLGDGACAMRCIAVHFGFDEEEGLNLSKEFNKYLSKNREISCRFISFPKTVTVSTPTGKVEKKFGITKEEKTRYFDYLLTNEAIKIWREGEDMIAIALYFNLPIEVVKILPSGEVELPTQKYGPDGDFQLDNVVKPKITLLNSADHFNLIIKKDPDQIEPTLKETEDPKESENPKKEVPFKCKFCQHTEYLKEVLEEHEQIKHSKEIIRELISENTKLKDIVKTQSLLKQHIAPVPAPRSHRQPHTQTPPILKSPRYEDNWRCDKCGNNFSNKPLLEAHVKNKHSETITLTKQPSFRFSAIKSCEICGKVYASQVLLDAHIKNLHNQKKEASAADENVFRFSKSINCNECGEECFSQNELKKHMNKTHTNKETVPMETEDQIESTKEANYICKVCKVERNTLNKLNKHMINHNEDGDWFCEVCAFQSNDIERLKSHMKDEDHIFHIVQIKLTKCNFCDAKFTIKSDMVKHRKQIHPTFKPCRNPVGCIFKEECFFNHEPIPEGKKRCFQCGTFFNSIDAMMVHRKNNHDGVKTCQNRKCVRGKNCWWIHDKPNQTEQSQGFQQCPVNMAPPLQTVPPNHQWSQKQPQKQIQPNQIEPEEENHTIKTMLKMMEDNLNIMKNMWNQMSMSN